MKTSEEIRNLAYERLSEAEILCNAGKYDGAFYLAGYSVELMLKAKICENFDINELFDEDARIDSVKDAVKIVRDSVKKHDLSILFIYSGLALKFQDAKSNQAKLMTTYALLISVKVFQSHNKEEKLWSEQARYLPIGSSSPQDVRKLIQLLKDDEGLLEWIKNT